MVTSFGQIRIFSNLDWIPEPGSVVEPETQEQQLFSQAEQEPLCISVPEPD